MVPLTNDNLKQMTVHIPIDVIMEGKGSAYGEWCNNNILQKSVICTDVSRGKMVWMDEDNKIIKEYNGGDTLCKKIFQAIEPSNSSIIDELQQMLQENKENKDMDIIIKKLEKLYKSKEGVKKGSKGESCEFVDDYKKTVKYGLGTKKIEN